MTLYLKHRPQSFEDVIGNEEMVEALQGILKFTDHPHVYLFTGPTGCGKTTLGRIVANELGCGDKDFRELDTADFRGIDTIREIRKQSQYRPLEGSCRVWLLDECAKLSNDAQHALLKALEDTPKHVYFILCTTDPQKLLPTVRGRCSQYEVKLLSDSQMLKLLRRVVKAEEESLQKQVYDQIIQDSGGHPRNALQILASTLSVSSDKRLEIAKRSAEEQSQVIELCRVLLNGAGWKKIRGILANLKDEDPERIRRAVLGYCNSVLLKEENNQAAAIMEEFLEPFYNTGWSGLTYACYSVISA